jgi:hypothetical protein
MSYGWPVVSDPLLDDALNIALDYLQATGQAEINGDTEQVAARAVLAEWSEGTRHCIRLANAAIVAVQQAVTLPSGRVTCDWMRC